MYRFESNLLQLTRAVLFAAGLLILSACQSTQLFNSQNARLLSFDVKTPFRAIGALSICEQTSCELERLTSAEIVAVSGDEMTLIYTDSPRNSIGFFDITDPENAVGIGRLDLVGEPTSVATKGQYALVVIDSSKGAKQRTGELLVVDIPSQSVIASLPLPGQPDSIAVSPDLSYAAVAIENQRSFTVNSGDMPQSPAGMVAVINIMDAEPQNWQITVVDVTGIASQFPSDPEPEYVDINAANQAVVTLQENNHIAVIDLPSAKLIGHFSAGTTIGQIASSPSESRFALQISSAREPDGVSWLADEFIVTADEGDYYGGTDTVTIFNRSGDVVWSSRDYVRRAVRAVSRTEKTMQQGAQPENIEVAKFANGKTYLFANIERADMVMVFDATDPNNPELVQILDTPTGPEGGLAVPSRGLLFIASENDRPGGTERSRIHIFQFNE